MILKNKFISCRFLLYSQITIFCTHLVDSKYGTAGLSRPHDTYDFLEVWLKITLKFVLLSIIVSMTWYAEAGSVTFTIHQIRQKAKFNQLHFVKVFRNLDTHIHSLFTALFSCFGQSGLLILVDRASMYKWFFFCFMSEMLNESISTPYMVQPSFFGSDQFKKSTWYTWGIILYFQILVTFHYWIRMVAHQILNGGQHMYTKQFLIFSNLYGRLEYHIVSTVLLMWLSVS